MKWTQFPRLAVALMLTCAPGVFAQSAQSQPAKSEGISPALLAKAKAGDAESQYEIGTEYLTLYGPSQDGIVAYWDRKAAEQGYAPAENDLGTMYATGSGVPQSYAEAVQWIRKAAKQGFPLSELGLAEAYEQGKGVPRDYTQAALWYHKAAEQGLQDAQRNLGWMYLNGQGVPRDYSKAYFWLDVAAAGGTLTITQRNIDAFGVSHLSPANLSREREQVRKWLGKHQAELK